MPVKIIFCYAHEDEGLLNKLKSHLRPLQRQGLIDMWYDRDISAGTMWEHEIDDHINNAEIILLLVSADFMNSDYCYSIELKRALERHKRGEAQVIPIILRHAYWQGELGMLQALPTGAKPVISWRKRDEAFLDITTRILQVVEYVTEHPFDFSLMTTEGKSKPKSYNQQRSNLFPRLRSFSDQLQPLKSDLLLVTASEVETQAVLNVFPRQGTTFKQHHLYDNTYFDLGTIGGTRTFLVQSEMGSGGPAGAALVVHDGIKALSPSSVIMVGIASGLIPEKQHLGDILVARQLTGYELQKIEQGSDEVEIIRLRGDRVQSSPRLLSRLRASVYNWQGPKVYFGLMLSGTKPDNFSNFRQKLLSIEPEAIGGEMEGTGLYSAAHRRKVDWILVKAICDWADGWFKDDAYQEQAAENAARFVLHVVQAEEFII